MSIAAILFAHQQPRYHLPAGWLGDTASPVPVLCQRRSEKPTGENQLGA